MSKLTSGEYLQVRLTGNDQPDWLSWAEEVEQALPGAVVQLSPDLLTKLLLEPNTNQSITLTEYLTKEQLRQALAITWREVNTASDTRTIKGLVTRILGLVKYNLVLDYDLPEDVDPLTNPDYFLPPQIASLIVRAASIEELEQSIRALYPATYKPIIAKNRRGEPHYTQNMSPLYLAVLKRAIMLVAVPNAGLPGGEAEER